MLEAVRVPPQRADRQTRQDKQWAVAQRPPPPPSVFTQDASQEGLGGTRVAQATQ